MKPPFLEHNDFDSIQRKSLWFESSRYHETLMMIAMLCNENSLSDFINDQNDLAVLINSMSP